MSEPPLDERNVAFWDELCGSALARAIGATGRTPEDLARFDAAYLHFYPYLAGYVPDDLRDQRVLEIGLGYGTLGQVIAERGARYTGVDIAPGPVEMMRHRLDMIGAGDTCDVSVASALDLPFEQAEFDLVVTIGCLHHTGDAPRAIGEVHRVLRPGGRAVVMVYNRWSVRRAVRGPRVYLLDKLRHRDGKAAVRALYDQDSSGTAAPHTDFFSTREVTRLFGAYTHVRVDKRNLSFPFLPAVRLAALRLRLDRVGGLDLYVEAVK